MNSKTIWIIVIIAILIVGAFFVLKDRDDSSGGNEGSSLDDIPDSEFSDIQTSDDVFNEIDSALEFIE